MEPERVLGGFEAVGILAHGRERVTLLFTTDRVIIVSRGKLGRASTALFSLFGKMASGADTVGKQQSLQILGTMSPGEILGLSDSNFAIPYGRVVLLLVEAEDSFACSVSLVTDRSKLVFHASRTSVGGVRELIVGLLGARLDFKA